MYPNRHTSDVMSDMQDVIYLRTGMSNTLWSISKGLLRTLGGFQCFIGGLYYYFKVNRIGRGTRDQVRQRRQRLRSTKLWIFKEREPAWTCCFYKNTQQKCGWRTNRADIYLSRVLAPLSTVYQIQSWKADMGMQRAKPITEIWHHGFQRKTWESGFFLSQTQGNPGLEQGECTKIV